MNSTYGNNTRCLFGTDGVRDVANRGVMTPEMAMRLARAFVLFLTERGTPRPSLVIGRDTRRSGQMLETAVIAGLTSAGANVRVSGVAPTPEVSYAVKSIGLNGGVVISASHNPAEYNGIKFLDSMGCKLSDQDEFEIEEYLGDSILDEWRPTGASIGTFELADTRRIYLEKLNEIFRNVPAGKLSCVVDCANGAASEVFSRFVCSNGLDWKLIGNVPDGLNINDSYGVMDLTRLKEEVLSTGSDVGIAFDGDADRTLLIDSSGRILDGDIIMWVLSRWMKSQQTLGSGLTATLMSNMALEDHLSPEGIKVHRCPVGDRYVFKTMKETGSRLGGEQSGHLIIGGYSSTGDGPCTGLLFLGACCEMGMEIGSLVDQFERYPQRLTNIYISGQRGITDDLEFGKLVSEAEEELGGNGRVFIRNSGTEPLLRVLVEARDETLLEQVSSKLVRNIKELYALN